MQGCVEQFSGQKGGGARMAAWVVVGCLVALAGAFGNASGASGDAAEYAVKMPLVDRSLLIDIEGLKGGEQFVAVGERGHIIASKDRGKTWQQAEVPTVSTLTAVFFIDSQNGWAVGHDAVILQTADGGRTWSRQNFAPEKEQPLLDVWFGDSRFGIAVGAYGLYLETKDGDDQSDEDSMRIHGVSPDVLES